MKNDKLELNDVTKVASRAAIAHAFKTFKRVFAFDKASYNWQTRSTDETGICLVTLVLVSVEDETEVLKYEAEMLREAKQWRLSSLRRLNMVTLDAGILPDNVQQNAVAKYIKFCEEISAEAEFALLEGWDGEEHYSYIGLRDGLSMSTDLFKIVARLQDVSDEKLAEALTEKFGTQFLGELGQQCIHEYHIVALKGGKLDILATVGYERLASGISHFHEDNEDAFIRKVLLGKSSGMYALRASQLGDMEAALTFGQKLLTIFSRNGRFPWTIQQVHERLDEHMPEPNGDDEVSLKEMLFRWGLDLLIYRHLGHWAFSNEDFGFFYEGFQETFYTQAGWPDWPSRTEELLAIARAFFGDDKFWHRFVWVCRDPVSGHTFSTLKSFPWDIGERPEIVIQHFGATGRPAHPSSYIYRELEEEQTYVAP